MTKQNQHNTEYSGLEEILNTEVMINYNSFIVGLAMKYSTSPKNVIDFGAGIGTLSTILRDSHQIEPMCVEIDEASKKYLLERGFKIYDDLYLMNYKLMNYFCLTYLLRKIKAIQITKLYQISLMNVLCL